jgi:hypothetical protein
VFRQPARAGSDINFTAKIRRTNMNKLKTLVVALVFGLAGVAYASNPASALSLQDKASCCSAGAACCDGGPCCAKDKEHESCPVNAQAKDCCSPGAACCDGGSCCSAKSESKNNDGKTAGKSKSKAGKTDCCSSGSQCCNGGSCCAKHKAKK